MELPILQTVIKTSSGLSFKVTPPTSPIPSAIPIQNNQLIRNVELVKQEDFFNIPIVPNAKDKRVECDAFSMTINSNEIYSKMSRERKMKFAGFFTRLLNDQTRFGKEFFHIIHNSGAGNEKIKQGHYKFSPFDYNNLEHLEIKWRPEVGDVHGSLHFHIFISVATKNTILGQSLGIDVIKLNKLITKCFEHKFSIKCRVKKNQALHMERYTNKCERTLAERL